MKRIVAGIVAHVDAGKTTLSEALLYRTGEIRKLGRVDHGDAFLDTNSLEKARGITIFAHQALVEHGDLRLTLLDGTFEQFKAYVDAHAEQNPSCLCFTGEAEKLGVPCVEYGREGDGADQASRIREKQPAG